VNAGGRAPHPAILTCIEAMEQDEHLMYMLVSLRQHDRYTFDHSCNVALLAVAIARQIGVAGEELRRFAGAVLLHDIGKLYTPLAVLNKPGRFSPDEWQVMKRHPVDGMEILDGAGFENLYSERVTLLHHVNFEGQGYPATTAQRPDLLAHIVQAADIYDAFTSIRPYRQQARPLEVLETLRNGAGKDFDPAVVSAVLKLMGETPMGAVLKLDNGQLGLVVDMGSSPDGRPIVRVIQDELGSRPARTTLVDLSARIPATGEYMVEVVEAIDPVIRNIPIGRYI
jgi:putative nucleotidyltransferase with HDIG domain